MLNAKKKKKFPPSSPADGGFLFMPFSPQLTVNEKVFPSMFVKAFFFVGVL